MPQPVAQSQSDLPLQPCFELFAAHLDSGFSSGSDIAKVVLVVILHKRSQSSSSNQQGHGIGHTQQSLLECAVRLNLIKRRFEQALFLELIIRVVISSSEFLCLVRNLA